MFTLPHRLYISIDHEVEYMDFLGTVEEIGFDGKIISKGPALPNTGDSVFDSRQVRIGKVKRVFGPVDEPYTSVIPDDKSRISGLVGKKLYFEGEISNGKGKRRYRRN